jgi:hypothetical protein
MSEGDFLGRWSEKQLGAAASGADTDSSTVVKSTHFSQSRGEVPSEMHKKSSGIGNLL